MIDDEVEKMLQLGVIRPSSSQWASPVLIVPKKDGSNRFCVDYRKLNSVTETEAAALPTPNDIFDALRGSKVFNILDLTSAYWQIRLSKQSRHKSAFITHRGLFEFNRVSFGLKNAPTRFQAIINQVLSKHIGKFCYPYLDDVVIYSKSEEDHVKHVESVLDALEKANMKLNRKKCEWFKSKLKLLGFTISSEGVESDPNKVTAIRNMPPPKDVSGIRSFLGSTNYFRNLIQNYATIAEPLTKLTKKNQKFIWTNEQQDSFEALKTALTNAPVLMYPDPNKEYNLYTDASDIALGAVLMQKDDDGHERPIQFISKKFASCQARWPCLEKEAYSILYALDRLKTYLRGAKFTVFTDNKPCVSLFKGQIKNAKLERWALIIMSYGGEIKHLPG